MEKSFIDEAEQAFAANGIAKFFSYNEGNECFYSEPFKNMYGEETQFVIGRELPNKEDKPCHIEEIMRLFDFFQGESLLSWTESGEVRKKVTGKNGVNFYYRSGTFVKLQLNGKLFILELDSLKVRPPTNEYGLEYNVKEFQTLGDAVEYMLKESGDTRHSLAVSNPFDDMSARMQWYCRTKTLGKTNWEKPTSMEDCWYADTPMDALRWACAGSNGNTAIKKDDGTELTFPRWEFFNWNSYSGYGNLLSYQAKFNRDPLRVKFSAGKRQYLASGAYAGILEYGKRFNKVVDEWGYISKFHFNTGDKIGRGYGALTVVKPFDAYISYLDYEKYLKADKDKLSFCEIYATVPEFGGDIKFHTMYFGDEEPVRTDEGILTDIFLDYFHYYIGCRSLGTDDEEVSKKSKGYLSYAHADDRIANLLPSDPITAYKRENLVERIEGIFFHNDDSDIPKNYKRPKGLFKFIEDNITIDDVVKLYKAAWIRVRDKKYRLVRKYDFKDTDLTMSWHGLGGKRYEKIYKSIYRKLVFGGFHPLTYAEANELIKAEADKAAKENEKREKNYRKTVYANIAKLTDDEKKAIIDEWSNAKFLKPYKEQLKTLYSLKDQDTKLFHLSNLMNHEWCRISKKATVGGKTLYFTEEMAKREPSLYERHFGTFIECLKNNGFDGEIHGDNLDVYGDPTKTYPNGLRQDMEYVQEGYDEKEKKRLFYLKITNKEGKMVMKYPSHYNDRWDQHDHTEDFFYSPNDDSFVDRIKRFVIKHDKENYFRLGGYSTSRHIEEDEFLYGTYGGHNDDDIYTEKGYIVVRRKFMNVCKDFLMSIGEEPDGMEKRESRIKFDKMLCDFASHLKRHGFKGSRAGGKLDMHKDTIGMVPKKWVDDWFREENTTYDIVITKADMYGERYMEIIPKTWEIPVFGHATQVGKGKVFRNTGEGFIAALKELFKECSEKRGIDVAKYIKEKEDDARMQFLTEAKDKALEWNKEYYYSHALEIIACKDFCDSVEDFLEMVEKA